MNSITFKVLATIFGGIMFIVCGYEIIDCIKGLMKKINLYDVLFVSIFTAMFISLIFGFYINWFV